MREVHHVGTTSSEACKQIGDALDSIAPLFSKYNESRSTIRNHSLWINYLDLIRTGNDYLYAERAADWGSHLNATKEMIPIFFASGNHKYAAVALNYLEEMLRLPEKAPEVHREFVSGNFVVRKTTMPFCSIACDLALESTVNLDIKGHRGVSGIVGATTNENARDRYLATLPFLAAVTRTLKANLNMDDEAMKHHEDTTAFTNLTIKGKNRVMDLVELLGNPFKTTRTEVYNFMTGDRAPEAVANSLLNFRDIGFEAMSSYLDGTSTKVKVGIVQTFASVAKKGKKKEPQKNVLGN